MKEKFIVKHYTSDDRPTIKGFGFDGLEIGEDREEAEEFISFINSILATLGAAKKEIKELKEKPMPTTLDWDFDERGILSRKI